MKHSQSDNPSPPPRRRNHGVGRATACKDTGREFGHPLFLGLVSAGCALSLKPAMLCIGL